MNALGANSKSVRAAKAKKAKGKAKGWVVRSIGSEKAAPPPFQPYYQCTAQQPKSGATHVDCWWKTEKGPKPKNPQPVPPEHIRSGYKQCTDFSANCGKGKINSSIGNCLSIAGIPGYGQPVPSGDAALVSAMTLNFDTKYGKGIILGGAALALLLLAFIVYKLRQRRAHGYR